MVSSLLDSVLKGCEEARNFIPRVLEVATTTFDTRRLFMEKCENIPAWMFLAWRSQLLASLGSSERTIVADILKRVAREYPQALFYPFSLSAEDVKMVPEAQSLVSELEHILHNETLEKFVEALEALDFPQQKFKDWKKACATAVADGNVEEVESLYKDMYNHCFGRKEAFFKEFGRLQRSFERSFGMCCYR